MRIRTIIATSAATALVAVPGVAIAAGGQPADTPRAPQGKSAPNKPEAPGKQNKPTTPGPKATLKAKAKAYGVYCKAESKKHVAGEKGTPFSRCVTNMAKVAKGKASPAQACKAESRKRAEGEKRSPFSRCVSAAAKLKRDRSDDETTTPETPETPEVPEAPQS